MLDDDIALFMHAFSDADDRELRAHCLSTLLEYEESMRAWEEAKNSGELDSDSTDSGDEDELTGSELLRDLDQPAPRAFSSTAPAARPGHIEWPKRVLRQTILVSSIAAEIESNIDRADWDVDCFEECRRLLQRETKQIETISDDRGLEEIPVLVDFEVQHWIAEALEGATRATELIIDRVASAGMHRPSQGDKEGRKKAGDLDPAASRAAQRDEGRDSRPPQRCTAGADSEVGVREEDPHRTGHNGQRRSFPGGISGNGARRQPAGRREGGVRGRG
jgi:hypothetical protein